LILGSILEISESFGKSETEESLVIDIERGGGPWLLVQDKNGNTLSRLIVNEEYIISSSVVNQDLSERTMGIEIFIIFHEGEDVEGKEIFYNKLIEKFESGEGKTVTWDFIPEKAGMYSIMVIPEGKPPNETSINADLPSQSDIMNKIKKMSPLKQIREGVLPENVVCKIGMDLIFKSTDISPACVKPNSVEKLIERGWGKPMLLIDSRLLDVRENPIVNLSMGSLVNIESDLIYRMNEQKDFSYVVTFYDENDNEFDKKWITSSLDPNENYSPSVFWVPCTINFVMRTIEIMDLELKIILSNSNSISKEISGEILTEDCGGRLG